MQRALEQDASAAIVVGDSFGSVVSDLLCLIGHVRASIELIEAAIVRDRLANDGTIGGEVAVLDDVTPFAEANAALIACNVSLSTALQSLLDASQQLLASERRQVEPYTTCEGKMRTFS
jgi:hypothetical protein